jgi:TetR/AcrR family transcriptional repressor of nem operon
MTKVLDVGREQGEFNFDGDPSDKALLILTSMQGASQLARMAGPATMDAAVRQIRADLGIGSELVRKWDRTEAIA